MDQMQRYIVCIICQVRTSLFLSFFLSLTLSLFLPPSIYLFLFLLHSRMEICTHTRSPLKKHEDTILLDMSPDLFLP